MSRIENARRVLSDLQAYVARVDDWTAPVFVEAVWFKSCGYHRCCGGRWIRRGTAPGRPRFSRGRWTSAVWAGNSWCVDLL